MALHLVDAVIYEKEKTVPPAHEIRRDLVRNKWYLRGISREYRSLKDYSEDARYRLITFTQIKIENVIIPLYRTIERHIVQQLPEQ